jgi:hypothetical protein
LKIQVICCFAGCATFDPHFFPYNALQKSATNNIINLRAGNAMNSPDKATNIRANLRNLGLVFN